MSLLKCCPLVVFAFFATMCSGQRDFSSPRFMVERGPNPVGLKVVEQYDRERIFTPRDDQAGNAVAGERTRPLQTLIWYPAEKSALPAMTVGDYLSLTKTETSFGHPEETTTAKGWNSFLGPVSTGAMYARRDATPRSAHYPVVIYSPSFSAVAWESADLCEYLASFGYVVIAAPAMGATTRESTHDIAGAEAQAADIGFLLGFAETLHDTDMTRVAVAGFSWGGLAGLLAAAHDDRIDALVSLDGSERYFPGFVQASGYAKPEQMRIPLIYFEEGDQSVEAQDSVTTRFHSQGPSVLNAWAGDLITVHALGLFHPAFYSMSYRNRPLWQSELPNLQIADYDYEDGLLEYSWVMRYTRAFLDGYLKHDDAAMNFLKATPNANGIPKHEMAVTFRAAKPTAAK